MNVMRHKTKSRGSRCITNYILFQLTLIETKRLSVIVRVISNQSNWNNPRPITRVSYYFPKIYTGISSQASSLTGVLRNWQPIENWWAKSVWHMMISYIFSYVPIANISNGRIKPPDVSGKGSNRSIKGSIVINEHNIERIYHTNCRDRHYFLTNFNCALEAASLAIIETFSQGISCRFTQ